MKSMFDLQAVSDIGRKDVYYILNNGAFFARIWKCEEGWRYWYYKDRFGAEKEKLSDVLGVIEKHFELNRKILNEIHSGTSEKSR